MSEHRQVDVAIIGAGTAGLRAYREARKFTDSVVLIEGGGWGTTCARVGCMPSKLLIAAAEAAQAVRDAPGFGIAAEPPRIDGRAVMARLRAERDRFVGHVMEAVQGFPEAQRIEARARFLSDTRLALDDGSTLEAGRVVIATGAHPRLLPIFEGLGDRLITNADVFELEDLPASVAVFGAGVIGLELGQALHRLGVRVTLYGKGGFVGPLTDAAVRDKAAALIRAEMPFRPDVDARPEATADGVRVTCDGATETFDYVLAATGREPNLGGLDLAATSLALDDRGVPHHDPTTGQCGDSPVFIAGDATAEEPLLHIASHEGQVAGGNAARFPEIRSTPRPPGLTILFTDPQIALVGQTRAELEEAGTDFAVGALDWSDQGRAQVMGVDAGRLHLYGARGTGHLLGAEMIGPRAEHLAHLLAWSIGSGLTVGEVLAQPFYHPVLEEGLRTALRDLNHALRMGPLSPPRCIDTGPGG
jgi:dihydrolipoamide dehydrogenase